jgi:cytochrome c-type biogenesis protein CcmH/NrfF
MEKVIERFMKGLFVLIAGFAAVSGVTGQTAPTQDKQDQASAKELTERVCSACHEISVATSERHSPEQWKAIVEDMVRRGAEASDAERKVILEYLMKNFGK